LQQPTANREEGIFVLKTDLGCAEKISGCSKQPQCKHRLYSFGILLILCLLLAKTAHATSTKAELDYQEQVSEFYISYFFFFP
jgi:hypothetical protein